MRVTVNGEVQDFPPGMTITAALERLGIESAGVAVERNLEIVPKSEHAQTALVDGDALEVIVFVGGG
jgi:thiamine biosynthesis protein ThiS